MESLIPSNISIFEPIINDNDNENVNGNDTINNININYKQLQSLSLNKMMNLSDLSELSNLSDLSKPKSGVSLCLNMIVRNESKIITRLLKSVLPIIDTYVICDTGSTDDTVSIIKDFFDSNGIYGKVIFEPFKNFGYNRTFALKAAKGVATYALLLDADMIFLRDISHNIRHFLDNTDLYVANRAYTYRGELVTSDFYRKAFTKNKLPNLYSYFTFFKKNKFVSKEFFSLCKEINEYKEEFKNLFLTEHIPKELGTDEIFALASKILDIDSEISYPLCFPKIVHLKPMIQNWQEPAGPVTNTVGFYLNIDAGLKIGNYQQCDIVHYQEKQLANDETISIMENALWKK